MQGSDIAILALIAVVLIAAIAIWFAVRRRHTHALRDKYGDEYDRTLHEHGKRAAAEAALEEREERVAELDIRPLAPANRAQFVHEWQEVKAVFVESPAEAALHADRLLAKSMDVRGYPMADFNYLRATGLPLGMILNFGPRRTAKRRGPDFRRR